MARGNMDEKGGKGMKTLKKKECGKVEGGKGKSESYLGRKGERRKRSFREWERGKVQGISRLKEGITRKGSEMRGGRGR